MAASRKKRRPCPSCGADFQKGEFVVRILGGTSHRQRVCQKCAGLATKVLASDAPCRCEDCGNNLARFCGACVARIISKGQGVRKLVEGLRTRDAPAPEAAPAES
jgi:hypothetical protein